MSYQNSGSSSRPVVAVFGALGSGKTTLVNKVCGTHLPVSSGTDSCTKTVGWGANERHNILVLDTPGFGALDDVVEHIAAQKVALEEFKLSGAYAVVRYQYRADPIAKDIEPLIDLLGDDKKDGARIIVTHMDQCQGNR